MTSPPTNGQPDPTNYSAMDFHVLNRLRELQVAAASAFLQQDFTLAARKLEESYNLVLGQQSIAARRFHKGWQLHNWGVALLNVGEHSEGTKRIFFAYVEDALTAQVGSEDNADAELAGQTLRSTGRFGRLLDAIKDVARFYKERDVIPFTPEPIFEDALNKALMTPESVEEDIGREVAESKLSRRRTIHELHSPHDKNCFLGGAYRSGGPNLEDLRSMIAAKGYEPIVAEDFVIDEQDTHHRCLLLLHLCSKAIFEVTVPAGQLMELERCRDYDIPPLIVQNVLRSGDLQASQMIGSMAGVQVKPYSTIEELRKLVDEYLRDSA